MDRLQRALALLTLGLEREVYHHDGILLDDADQEDDADDGDHAEVVAEEHQHEERADARRRQRREDRDRMDVALVQHAQHDVDHEDRGGDQQRRGGERLLECLSRSLERALQRRGHLEVVAHPLDGIDGLSERRAGRQVERQRHRWKLTLMVHR